MKYWLSIMMFCVFHSFVNAQNVPGIMETDSVDPDLYPYVLPIMGDAVAARDITLPLPFGVMVNGFLGNQFLELQDMKVGFNNSDLINLDGIVEFGEVKATAYSPNIRLDAWVLPFLNVYTITGYGISQIEVNINSPIQLTASTTSQGGFIGFGALAAGAYRNMFFSLDVNRQYIFTDKLDEPAEMGIVGFRTGPIFRNKKDMNKNWIIWTGVMRTDLASETKGQINVTDVFPDAGGRIDGWVNGINDWYTALPPRLQDRYMDQYNRLVQGLQDIQNGVEDGTIRYQMQKVIPKPWNLLLGVQYQSSNR